MKLCSHLFLMVLTLLFTPKLWAAGGGGSISDLLFPAINVSILVLFFVWKVLPIIKNSFIQLHDKTSEAVNLADVQEANAQIQLKSAREKIKNLPNHQEAVLEKAKKQALDFEQEYTNEINDKIERVQKDNQRRLEGEKQEVRNQIMQELLNQVVEKSKAQIKSDKVKQKEIVENFSKRLS